MRTLRPVSRKPKVKKRQIGYGPTNQAFFVQAVCNLLADHATATNNQHSCHRDFRLPDGTFRP